MWNVIQNTILSLQLLHITIIMRQLKYQINRELNVRCLYLMAKCEQNTMFNNETNYYGDGSMTDVTSKYKSSFKRLKTEYSDTKFNKMILKECSFYRYYCSL